MISAKAQGTSNGASLDVDGSTSMHLQSLRVMVSPASNLVGCRRSTSATGIVVGRS